MSIGKVCSVLLFCARPGEAGRTLWVKMWTVAIQWEDCRCACGLYDVWRRRKEKYKWNKETSSAKSLCHRVVVKQECQNIKKTCWCCYLSCTTSWVSSSHRPSHPSRTSFPPTLPYHCISRVSDHNGVSLLNIVLDIHHSGREPLICNVSTHKQPYCLFNSFWEQSAIPRVEHILLTVGDDN